MAGAQVRRDGSKVTLVNTGERNMKIPPNQELLKISQGKISESVTTGIPFNLCLKDFVKISDGGDVVSVKQLIAQRMVKEIYMHGSWAPGKPPISLSAKKRVAIAAEDAWGAGGCNELATLGVGCLRALGHLGEQLARRQAHVGRLCLAAAS